MITAEVNKGRRIPKVPDYNRLAEVGGSQYTSDDNFKVYLAILGSVQFMDRREITPKESGVLRVDVSHYFQGEEEDSATVENAKELNRTAKTDEMIACPMCGEKFFKSKHKIYCSRACRAKYYRIYGL